MFPTELENSKGARAQAVHANVQLQAGGSRASGAALSCKEPKSKSAKGPAPQPSVASGHVADTEHELEALSELPLAVPPAPTSLTQVLLNHLGSEGRRQGGCRLEAGVGGGDRLPAAALVPGLCQHPGLDTGPQSETCAMDVNFPFCPAAWRQPGLRGSSYWWSWLPANPPPAPTDRAAQRLCPKPF